MTISSISSNPAAVALLSVATPTAATSTSGSDTDGGARKADDSAQISGPGKLFAELQQLQSQDPAKFKQVTADIASKLQTAASQATGGQADFLNSLADKFQTASTTGSASGLQPSAHHHHHQHSVSYNQQGQAVPAPVATSASSEVDLKQLFSSISTEVAQAVSA